MSLTDSAHFEAEARLGKELANRKPIDLPSSVSPNAPSSPTIPQHKNGTISPSAESKPSQNNNYIHPSKRPKRKDITLKELGEHNTKDSIWIHLAEKVYDITPFLDKHPGGMLPLVNMAGKDATDAFANYHPDYVYRKYLPSFYIGDLIDYKASEFTLAHRALRKQLDEAGMFKTDMKFYYKLFTWFFFLFSTAIYLSVTGESIWRHLLGACFMALFWQQFAFYGHDAGHNAITHDRNKDIFWGAILSDTFGGISTEYWKRSHNVHHIVCNSVEHDPDIQHQPALAVDPKLLGKYWSTYHFKWFTTDPIAKFMVSYQHILFYPIMAFGRFNIYFQGWKVIFDFSQKCYNRLLEAVCLFIFLGWLSLLVSTFPTWKERIAWLVVSHALAGILHVQITISHFAEPVYHGHAYNSEDDEWFKMQLATTMNVDCPWWMDWFHGGLQFQIEHHLFPRIPRHNLRK